MMEGYGHNPLIFDLMFELAWRDDVELKSWVQDFSRFRYGKANADAQAAWETLRTGLYNRSIDGGKPSSPLSRRADRAIALSRIGLDEGLAAAAAGAERTGQHRDLPARPCERRPASPLQSCRPSSTRKRWRPTRPKTPPPIGKRRASFLQLIRDLDELLATNDEFLLGSWLEDAKRWGATDAERAKLEWNARRILTLWGTGAALRDYAWKEWSGLLTGFYAQTLGDLFPPPARGARCWQAFRPSACHAELYRFENEWCQQTERYPSKPKGDSIEVAQRLFDKYMIAPPQPSKT